MPDFGIFRGFNSKLFSDKLYAGQLPTQLGLIGSQDFGFDADYTAILNYATTQGYTLPSVSQRIKQNKLVLDLKSYNIWSKLDSFSVFATDGNSNFALIDWKRLSQLTAVNSPTFTSNQGFTGNGASSYINTNFNPNANGVNLTLNSTSYGFYYRIGSSAVGVGSGNYIVGNSNGLYINPLTGASPPYLMRSWNNSTSGVNAGTTTNRVGLFHTDRNNSSNIYHIKDGVELANPTLSSNTRPNGNLYLLAALYAGNAVEFGNEQISMYFAGGSLYSQRSDLNTAWTTYINSL
jgi:hypothetical protein